MDVIYLNGGSGKRVGLGYPKQFSRINGKPLLIYGIETLKKIEQINKIIVPTQDEDMGKTLEIITSYNLNDNLTITVGGKSRQESVLKALVKVNSTNVLICEAVRPFMSKELIEKVIKEPGNCVVPFDPSVATVIDIYGNTYNRNVTGCVQMPQRYKTWMLKQVYKYFEDKAVMHTATDDFDLIRHYESINQIILFEVKNIFKGDYGNIKITYPIDLKIAEAILREMDDE